MSIVPKQCVYKFTRLRAVCAATARLLFRHGVDTSMAYSAIGSITLSNIIDSAIDRIVNKSVIDRNKERS